MNAHPVLAKIDRDHPYFERRMTRRHNGTEQQCHLQVWLPVQLDNGGWVAAIHIIGFDLSPISAMPGEDPLDALVSALAFARDAMERAEGSFLFGDREREMGGLPVSLDRGFTSNVPLEIETQAACLANTIASDRQRRMLIEHP